MRAPSDGSLSDFALRWLEDETFFSICSRQHRYIGNMNSASTLTWLFGSSKAGTNHDFPFNLEALNDKAKASWGDSTSIILEHTILPFFFPFQSPQHVAQAIATLKSPSLGSLKYRLGLLTGRFGAEHPLKACSECMISDRAASGVAYWHLMHQYPGVVLCPKHHRPLRECSKNRQWSGRFQWCLPNDDILSPVQHNDRPADVLRKLDSLTLAILQLAKFGNRTCFNPDIVCKTYRTALAELSADRPSVEGTAASFARYTALLQAHTTLTTLPGTTGGAAALLGQLTRQPRGYCHPLKHLILIEWLFGSLDLFVEAYNRLSITELLSNNLQNKPDVEQPTGHIQSHHSTSGKTIIRRPKTLKEPVRLSILERLSNGEDKQAVCTSFKVTISTINKLLRSEPHIRELWMAQRKSSNTNAYRQAWLSAMESYPDFGVKRVRSYIPHVYIWLYRNDQLWLNSQIEQLPSDRRGNHSNIDWLKRDAKLFESIQTATNSKSSKSAGVSREALYFRFPDLSKCLEQDKHYPQTKTLVRQLIGRLKSGRR